MTGVTVQYHRDYHLAGETLSIRQDRLTVASFEEFLGRSNLGKVFPRDGFERRVEDLAQNAQISLVARDGNSRIVGVCLGLTDFSYRLLVTDIGIDRAYERSGLGRELVRVALDLSGGETRIALFARATGDSRPFFERIGMSPSADMMERYPSPDRPFISGRGV
jgi:ribosomal protein S18 acetylase RimI-like enzyme